MSARIVSAVGVSATSFSTTPETTQGSSTAWSGEIVSPGRRTCCVFARPATPTSENNLTPKAAKANDFWFGDCPEELLEANWVEWMAASAVRMSGTVVASQDLKVRGVPRSAKTLTRGSFTFYAQDSYTIAQRLPLCDTYTAGSIAVALVGYKPTEEKMRRFFCVRENKWWTRS